jgi:tetratricopeptide (TPR) repeat protein
VAWAAAFEWEQRWGEAAARYQEAAALVGPYSGEALVGEARAREQAGELEQSRELYRRAFEQFPELPARDLLQSKIGS